ncbi:unnamed protein product [Adineta steineri]|uniref:Uncharacterized protein n=1 Tax=Adineta steineri TaxID=433720 RepID=A0A819XML9_9BILA|nr:unnamed protein product [Adineta steineri]
MHYNLQENVVEQKMITNDFESTMYMPVLKLIVGFRLLNRSLLFKTARAAHCLVTKSKQPTMNENSKIISKADLTTDSLDLETIPNLSSKTDPHRILSRIVVFIYEDVIFHELFPAIMTCILANQLDDRPDADNDWALHDYASSH